MKVVICTSQEGNPIVSIEGETIDRPEDVAEAYKKVIKKLEED